jgi:putative membrane protein
MQMADQEKKYRIWLILLSVVVPLLVTVLIFMPKKLSVGEWVYFLPHLNGIINSVTSVLLIIGFIMIRKGRIQQHRNIMISAFILGSLFLVSYVVYHASAPSTRFGDIDGDGLLSEPELTSIGSLRLTYFIILISHILLAIAVVPFVLIAMFRGLTERFDKHRKIARIAFPIWLYVSITGVIVYLMISPYYQF